MTNFGAFIDLGVKRDGLVHVSELTHEWVDDPRKVVHVGQIVKAKVLEVDHERGRISLSLKALEAAPAAKSRPPRAKKSQPQHTPRQQQTSQPESAAASPSGQTRRSSQPNAGGGAKKKPQRPKEPERPTTIEDLLEKWGKKH